MIENKKHLYNGNFQGMNGFILESRGGAKKSKNVRNVDYKLLLLYVLETFKNENYSNIQIFVASRNSAYKSIEDRKIIIEGKDVFNFQEIDIDDFIKKLSFAIKKSGQKGNEKGGNSTKRLFFYQKENEDVLFQPKENKSIEISFSKELFLNAMKNFKYEYDKKTKDVKILQEELYLFLKKEFGEYQWYTEYQFEKSRKDRFDIYGIKDKQHIIIELDPHRADSIAKKFVSRLAMAKSLCLTYISFLYKGTDRMSIKEAKKYLSDCESIIETLNNDIIDTKKEFIGYCHFKSK